jgi:hypothetical protein
MTHFQRKEANRYYWIIKGMLIPESWSDHDIMKVYDSYFNRIWGNHEAIVHEVGFEAAWAARQAEIINRSKK